MIMFLLHCSPVSPPYIARGSQGMHALTKMYPYTVALFKIIYKMHIYVLLLCCACTKVV